MKIGMKEDMGIADEMVLFVLGSCAGNARNCARSSPERTFAVYGG